MTVVNVNMFQLLLTSLTVLVTYWLWTRSKRSYSKFNIPPFPVKPWPFVGHFFMLFGNLRDKLKEWRKTGGQIYSLDTAGQLNILVNDFKDIKEIWVKRADYIVNLQPSLGFELLQEHNRGITTANDDNWREQRSTSITILRNLGMGKNIMAEKIETEVTVVIDKLASFRGQPECVKMLFLVAISNIVSSLAVGQRFDYDDSYFVQLMQPICTFIKYFFRMMMLTDVRPVCYIPGDLFKIKVWVQETKKIRLDYIEPFIKKHKQEFSESEEPQNFISAYLQEMKRASDKGVHSYLDEPNLIAIVRELFAAGTETTSNTISWCLLYMLHYPDVQEKVYREIEAVVGTERIPNLNDKSKLVYLNATIMETQRWCSLVPIGFKREVNETFEYGGFTFPKGCVVWPILDAVHYDKTIWGDPDNFRPERFIDQKGALINREELIPFSIGRRVCPGEALAKMELFLYLSAIFQRFKLEPVDKSNLPTLTEHFGMNAVPQNYKLRFIDR